MFKKNISKSKVSTVNTVWSSIVMAAMILICSTVRAGEISPAKWRENAPLIMITYDYDVNDMYAIYYNNSQDLPDGDNYNRFEKIHLLMVNGGFVPHNGIVIKNNTAMIPTGVIEDVFGAEVYYDENERTINIALGGTSIVFGINIGDAEVNGRRYDIEASAFFKTQRFMYRSNSLPRR